MPIEKILKLSPWIIRTNYDIGLFVKLRNPTLYDKIFVKLVFNRHYIIRSVQDDIGDFGFLVEMADDVNESNWYCPSWFGPPMPATKASKLLYKK